MYATATTNRRPSSRSSPAEYSSVWLREAAATGFPCYSLFARDSNLDRIRSEPQFQSFMTEMEKQSTSLHAALFPVSRSLTRQS